MRSRIIDGRMNGPFSRFDISHAICPYVFHNGPFRRSYARAESSSARAPNESCRANMASTERSTVAVGRAARLIGTALGVGCAVAEYETDTSSVNACQEMRRAVRVKARFLRVVSSLAESVVVHRR